MHCLLHDKTLSIKWLRLNVQEKCVGYTVNYIKKVVLVHGIRLTGRRQPSMICAQLVQLLKVLISRISLL